MMRKKRLLWIGLVLALLLLVLTAQAQDDSAPVNPNANISFPPPVYVLRGEFTVFGSANLPNMVNHFLEFRALAADLSVPDEEAPWTPVSLPNSAAVQDDVLGMWDTTTAPDGLYELRLTINVSRGGEPVYFLVSPLRVENTLPPFLVGEGTPLIPTFAPVTPQNLPTLMPTPTAFDPTPQAEALVNANVRRGDSTAYEAFASLRPGDVVPVVGISAFGTGWYLVELPDGRRGWVAPSVVSVTGDIGRVPRVQPPPPPPPTPIPATATPIATVNLVAGNFSFVPGSPVCAQTFNIFIDVANFGTTPSPSGFILVQDLRNSDRSLQQQTFGAIPVIQPGQTVNIGPIPLTVSTFYNEDHRLVMLLDPSNQIPETNENDNLQEAIYMLQKGGCP